MGEACSTIGERKCSQNFYKEPEGKIPLRRSKRRWLDNVGIFVREIGQDEIDWIHLAQDRDQSLAFVKTGINLLVPQNSKHFLTN
jgi:hypothetical protein